MGIHGKGVRVWFLAWSLALALSCCASSASAQCGGNCYWYGDGTTGVMYLDDWTCAWDGGPTGCGCHVAPAYSWGYTVVPCAEPVEPEPEPEPESCEGTCYWYGDATTGVVYLDDWVGDWDGGPTGCGCHVAPAYSWGYIVVPFAEPVEPEPEPEVDLAELFGVVFWWLTACGFEWACNVNRAVGV